MISELEPSLRLKTKNIICAVVCLQCFQNAWGSSLIKSVIIVTNPHVANKDDNMQHWPRMNVWLFFGTILEIASNSIGIENPI